MACPVIGLAAWHFGFFDMHQPVKKAQTACSIIRGATRKFSLPCSLSWAASGEYSLIVHLIVNEMDSGTAPSYDICYGIRLITKIGSRPES